MEFRITIHNIDDSATERTLFNIRVDSWSLRINAPGKMVFYIKKHDDNINLESDLQIMKRVRLWRRNPGTGAFEKVWFGYIDAYEDDSEQEVGIVCAGMLQLFDRRQTGASVTLNGQGDADAFSLLTTANSDDDTGVNQGTGDVTNTEDITVDEVPILSVWESIARATDSEFEIDVDGNFNFLQSLGSDQTASTNLRYRRDGTPGNNVLEFDDGQDGAPMATRIYARSSGGGGGLSTTRNSSSAIQSKYGVLEKRVQFSEANDLTTLQNMADSLLGQLEKPATATKIRPEMESKKTDIITGSRTLSGFGYDDFGLGDLRTVDILTEQSTYESVTRRIVEITVSVDGETGQENVELTLTEAGIFISADYLDAAAVRDTKKRIDKLESLL